LSVFKFWYFDLHNVSILTRQFLDTLGWVTHQRRPPSSL